MITKLVSLVGLAMLSISSSTSAAEISGTIDWTFEPSTLENMFVFCLPLADPASRVEVLVSRPWNYTCPDLEEGTVYKVFTGAVVPIARWGPCESTGTCGELYRVAGDGRPANFVAYPYVARIDLRVGGDLESLTLTANFYRPDGFPIGPTGVVEFWEYDGSVRGLLSKVYVENQLAVDSDTVSLAPGQHTIGATFHSVDDFWVYESDPITVGGD